MLLSKFGFGPLGGGTLRAGSRERDGSPATSLNFLKSDDTARSPSRQAAHSYRRPLRSHSQQQSILRLLRPISDFLFVTVRWSPEVPTLVDGRKKGHSLLSPIDYLERPDLLVRLFDLVRPASHHTKTSH